MCPSLTRSLLSLFCGFFFFGEVKVINSSAVLISDFKRNNPNNIVVAFSTSEFPSPFMFFITI